MRLKELGNNYKMNLLVLAIISRLCDTNFQTDDIVLRRGI